MCPKGGHNRKSDAEKKLSGTFRKDRAEGTKRPPRDPLEKLIKAKGYTVTEVERLYDALPSAETASAPAVEPVGPAPKSLPHAARLAWEKLRPELDAKGTYRGRRLLLENYCRSQARLESPELSEARYTGLLSQVQKMLASLLAPEEPTFTTPVPGQRSPAGGSEAESGRRHPKYPDLLVGDTEPPRWSAVALTPDPVRRRREFIAWRRWKYGDAAAEEAQQMPENGVWLGAQPSTH
jgi:hypothetical protein